MVLAETPSGRPDIWGVGVYPEVIALGVAVNVEPQTAANHLRERARARVGARESESESESKSERERETLTHRYDINLISVLL